VGLTDAAAAVTVAGGGKVKATAAESKIVLCGVNLLPRSSRCRRF
jgi:hypothetical protein